MTDSSSAGSTPAISEVHPDRLAAWLTARGERAYRARQILAGSHRPGVSDFGDLTELPRALRSALEESFTFSTIRHSHALVADGGLTAKAVHELGDGQRIESVLMRYPRRSGGQRTTICISSQAGCAVGCPFCATGQAGFARQLSAGEIVDQVLHWHRAPWLALGPDWRPGTGAGHYNIVFMGMGEPLNNTDRVFEAFRLPAGSRFHVNASGHHMDVDSDFPTTVTKAPREGRFVGDVNGGGPELRVSTHNGSLRLRKG